MKQKLLSIILMFTLVVGAAYAQDRQVSGKVTSAVDGAPVIGASVALVGSSTATQTDASGNYSLTVPADGTLNFSYIGFLAQRLPVNNRAVVNVALNIDDTSLDEVVVTALGAQRSAKSLTYGKSGCTFTKIGA